MKIGIAVVNSTPEAGLDRVGNYPGNDAALRGIHDLLYANALVASDNMDQKVAILSIDICELPKGPVDFMRSYIASKREINQKTF